VGAAEFNQYGYVYAPEVSRRFDEILAELRLLRQELVRRDVYEVERREAASEVAGLREDMATLERRLAASDASRVSMRRSAGLAVLAAVLSLIGSLIIQLIPQ
jgi:hypothetical protein